MVTPPPETSDLNLYNECFVAARHEDGCYLTKGLLVFFLLVRRSVERRRRGFQGTPYFEEIRPGAGFKYRRFRRRTVGGALP